MKGLFWLTVWGVIHHGGKAWWLECEATGHTTSAVRKQRVTRAANQEMVLPTCRVVPPHLNLSINPPSEKCPEVCLLGDSQFSHMDSEDDLSWQSETVTENGTGMIKTSSLTKALEILKTPSPTSACESLNYEWSWTQNSSVLHWETELEIRRSRFFRAFVVWI